MPCVSWTRAHAADYLIEIAQLIQASGGHLPATWLDGVLHRLKHEGPDRLLRHVSRLAVRYPQVQEKVTYLQKRCQQMDYPTYQKHGWPIGSGTVESGHKLLMQARLKGPGCIGNLSTSTPCSPCAWLCATSEGRECWDDQRHLHQQQRFLRRRTHQ